MTEGRKGTRLVVLLVILGMVMAASVQAILALKEARAEGCLPIFLSVDLYRAVRDGGTRSSTKVWDLEKLV